MLLAGVGVYAVPQTSAAQLLSRAQPAYASVAFRQQSASEQPAAPASSRSQSGRSLKRALTELERRFNVNFAYDEQALAGRRTELEFNGLSLDQALNQLSASQGLR